VQPLFAMSSDEDSSHSSSDADSGEDFDDLNFFDQELLDKHCSDEAMLKKQDLAVSLAGAEELFIKDGGCVHLYAVPFKMASRF